MWGAGQRPIGPAWLHSLEGPSGWGGGERQGRDALSLGRGRGVLALCPAAHGPSAAVSRV